MQLTLSPSKMLSTNESYFYLHGALEGFVTNTLSFSGESYYSMGAMGTQESTFQYNHNLFFGASKHFVSNNHDLYIGLQPGVSFTKINSNLVPDIESKMGVNPVISEVVGYNFYVNKLFHFFVETRFIEGTHKYTLAKSLNEVRFSAGLAFNINAF